MEKRGLLKIVFIFIIFLLIAEFKIYGIIFLGFILIYILIVSINELTKSPIKKEYYKIETVLIKVEDLKADDENAEIFNMILFYKDVATNKEYKSYRLSFNKPKVGLLFYINVNKNDENDYYIISHMDGENINLTSVYIGACIVCIFFIVFLLYFHINRFLIE